MLLVWAITRAINTPCEQDARDRACAFRIASIGPSPRLENGSWKVGSGSGGMNPLRVAQESSTFTLSGDREGGKIITVDMYRKVWLAGA
jgi:hypothetical protein